MPDVRIRLHVVVNEVGVVVLVRAVFGVVVDAHRHPVLFADPVPYLPRGDRIFGEHAGYAQLFGKFADGLYVLFAPPAGDAKAHGLYPRVFEDLFEVRHLFGVQRRADLGVRILAAKLLPWKQLYAVDARALELFERLDERNLVHRIRLNRHVAVFGARAVAALRKRAPAEGERRENR